MDFGSAARPALIATAMLGVTLSTGACGQPLTSPPLSPAVPGGPPPAVSASPLLQPVSLVDDPAGGGSGGLGREIEADNRDCPPEGADISVPSAQGGVSCAPTGAGPGTGEISAVPAAGPAAGKVTPSGPSGASPFSAENH
jgi:hypothetical protein